MTRPGVRAAAALCLSATMLLAAVTPGLAQTLAPVEGVWRTESGTEVTIQPCGRDLCGYITRVVVPEEILRSNSAIGQMAVEEYFDANNEDPALRSRKILGMKILTLDPGGNERLIEGEIYNPQDGRTYGGYIEVLSDTRARLTGCVLWGSICQGEDWVRVPPPVVVEEMPVVESATAG